VLYVCLTTGNVMDMYKTIAWELGLPIQRNRAALFRQIRGEVTRLCGEARQKLILIIDKAHHLRSDVLEDLAYSPTTPWTLTTAFASLSSVTRSCGAA
jgi:type II secretory pathway predicted ATPase ExeA